MKIILVGGKAGSGKNTVAKIIQQHLESKGKRVLVLGNGDKVREYAKKYFNLDNYKTDEGRRIMIGITDMMYDLYPNYYDKKTMETFLKADVDVVIISDWRYPCTHEYFKANPFLDVHSIYLKRQSYHRYAKDIEMDKSETPETLRDLVDFTIYNETSTIDQLKVTIELYLQEVVNV